MGNTRTTTRAKQIWAVHLPDRITPRPATEPEAPRRATLVAVVVATAATTTRHTSRRVVPHTRRQQPTTAAGAGRGPPSLAGSLAATAIARPAQPAVAALAAGERDPMSSTRQQLQPVVSPKTPRQRHDKQQPFLTPT